MEQKKNNNVWKIVLISLGVAAVVGAGIFVLVKVIKKKKSKKIILEWDDEDAFEKCMNGHGDCEVVIIADEI